MYDGCFNSGFQYSQENIASTTSWETTSKGSTPATAPLSTRGSAPATAPLSTRCQRLFVRLDRAVHIVSQELNWFCSHTSLRALPRVSRAVSPQARLFWTVIFTVLLTSAIVCLYFLITSFIQFKTSFETQESKRVSPFPSVTVCPHRPLSRIGEARVREKTPHWFASQYTRWVERYVVRYPETNYNGNQNDNAIPFSYPSYSQYFQRFNISDLLLYAHQEQDLIVECRVNTGSTMGLTSIAVWSECDQLSNKAKIERIIDSKHFLCYTLTLPELMIDTANGVSLTLFLENYIDVKDGDSTESLTRCQQCMSLLPETWRQGARVVIHQPNTRPDMTTGIDLSPGSINEITFDTVFTNYMTPPYGDCTLDVIGRPIEANNVTYNYTIHACEQQQLQDFIHTKCSCLDPTLPMTIEDYKNPVYCEFWPWEVMAEHSFTERRAINNSRCLNQVRLIYNQRKYNRCPKPCTRITNTVKTSSTIGFRRSMLHHLYTRLQTSGRIAGTIPSIEHFEALVAANKTHEAASALMLARDFHDSFIVLDVKRQDFSPKVIKQREDFKLYNLMSMIGGVCSLFLGFSIFVFFELGEVVYYIVRGLMFKDSRPRAVEVRRRTQRRVKLLKEADGNCNGGLRVSTNAETRLGAVVGPSSADVLAKYNPYPLNLTEGMYGLQTISIIPTVSSPTVAPVDSNSEFSKRKRGHSSISQANNSI